MIDDMLLDGELIGMGLVDRTAVERMISEDRAGVADRSKELWQFLTLEEWIRQTEQAATRCGDDDVRVR